MLYRGSCHCGSVKFSVETDLSKVVQCNCSICKRKNAKMNLLPKEAIKITQGQKNLSIYQDAVQRLQEQRTRTGQAASQIGNIGTAAYKGAASELGQLGIVGSAKQQQAQTALDTEYAEWLKQREQPFREMGKYQSMVIGAPMGQTQFEPSKPATFGPSVGQQIVGGLGGLGQLYGQFSGKTLAGTPYQFPKKHWINCHRKFFIPSGSNNTIFVEKKL